jgi:hypothetical protein
LFQQLSRRIAHVLHCDCLVRVRLPGDRLAPGPSQAVKLGKHNYDAVMYLELRANGDS